jgi:hypothetical protein
MGTLLHSFGSVWGTSKVSLVLKLIIEWWRLLLKFVDMTRQVIEMLGVDMSLG